MSLRNAAGRHLSCSGCGSNDNFRLCLRLRSWILLHLSVSVKHRMDILVGFRAKVSSTPQRRSDSLLMGTVIPLPVKGMELASTAQG